MAKVKTPTEEKFENTEFDLFEALAAIDRKDYGYFDRLTEEQKQKFNPFMLVQFLSSVKANTALEQFHLLSTNEFSNTHIFNEHVQSHPKLQWLMLCAGSLGKGKQFHQFIPSIKESVSSLKEKATIKDTKEYYKKIYNKASDDDLTAIAESFVESQHKKYELAKRFPLLKLEDVEVLAQIVTLDDIRNYDKECGN